MIISRFYVIYGDGIPIYVGYTNRKVQQRFKEHKEDKDFSMYEKVISRQVDKLTFDFTWDITQVNLNAKKVSDHESKLIKKYGTADSIYQKADGGGQTWADIKSFVFRNKDNPRFTGLSGQQIEELLAEQNVKMVKCKSFIYHIEDERYVKCRSFINDIEDERYMKCRNFINRIDDKRFVKCKNFISNVEDKRFIKCRNFINNIK